MLEAIRQATGPVWAFLAQVGMLLGISVPIEDAQKKMEASGASKDVVDAAVKAAVFEDFDAFWHYCQEAHEPESDPYWSLIYELQLFLSSPSWGRAVKVARAIRLCETDERVVAACLVAATGARPVRAIAEE